VLRNLFGSSKTTASPETITAIPASTPAQLTESVLGTGTRLEGTLHSPGAVRLEGKFTGNITALGRVSLSSEADLEGDVVGGEIIVGGILHGNITARRVTILRTGRIWGDLQTEQLATEEGSFIQGIITMQEKLDIPAVVSSQEEALQEAQAAEGEAMPAIKEPVPFEVRNTRSNR